MATQDNGTPNVDATVVPQVAAPQVATAAASSLAGPVPQIVITKVSPLNQVQSTPSAAENVVVNVPADVSEGAAVPVSSESSGAPKQAELQCDDSGEEFKATEDCGQCIVSLPDELSEAAVSEVAQNPEAVGETATRIGRAETLESEEADFRSIPGCCRDCVGCPGFYYRTADAFVTVYSLPFWLILLGVPLSAGFMGGKYMDGCPGRSTLPTLVFFIGIGGVIMLSAQICCIISGSVCRAAYSCVKHYASYIACIAGMFSLMALIAENVAFFTLKSDFNSLSPAFCHPTFYEYTRWMNCAVWLAIFLVLAIRGPVSCIRVYSSHLN